MIAIAEGGQAEALRADAPRMRDVRPRWATVQTAIAEEMPTLQTRSTIGARSKGPAYRARPIAGAIIGNRLSQ
jgi:hypothetical protein